jgi:hypothetical protein
VSDTFNHALVLARRCAWLESRIEQHGDHRGFDTREAAALHWALDLLTDYGEDDVTVAREAAVIAPRPR